MFPLLKSKAGKLAVSAHRGASAYAPENTMPAFEKALEIKADIIEFDVHLSQDNQCVVLHDETLSRTTNASGHVWDYSWAELKKLNAGQSYPLVYAERKPQLPEYMPEIDPAQYITARIPLLEEVLVWSKAVRMPISIEVKSPWPFYYGLTDYPFRIVEKVLELVARHGDEDLTSLHSFDHRVCLRSKELNPRITTMVSMGGAILVDPLGPVRAAQANGLAIGGNWVTPELVEILHAEDVALFGWGLGEDPLNQAADLRKLVGMGVDFVSGGAPDALRAVLQDLLQA